MKILLIAHGKDTFPAGLADIYFYLKSQKCDVDIINVSYASLNTIQYVPDIIGITSMTKEIFGTISLAKKVILKWPKAKIVLGGRHFISRDVALGAYQDISQADHIVIGEGEYRMHELITGEATDRILIGTPLSESDYRALPFPDKNFIYAHMRPTINAERSRALFTRGCPYKCIFCESNYGRKKVITKEPGKSVAHIKNLVQWFGYKDVFIYDDIFTVYKPWLYEFKREWDKQKPGARLRLFIHAKLFDGELLDLLLSINTKSLCLGAESGDDSVLKVINKRTTIADYLRVDQLIKKHGKGIEFRCLWMVGNITETAATMRKTVELSRKIGTTKPWFSYAIPFPGTEFWRVASQYGKVIELNFTQWGNTNIIFVPNGTTKEEMLYWYHKGMGWQ